MTVKCSTLRGRLVYPWKAVSKPFRGRVGRINSWEVGEGHAIPHWDYDLTVSVAICTRLDLSVVSHLLGHVSRSPLLWTISYDRFRGTQRSLSSMVYPLVSPPGFTGQFKTRWHPLPITIQNKNICEFKVFEWYLLKHQNINKLYTLSVITEY